MGPRLDAFDKFFGCLRDARYEPKARRLEFLAPIPFQSLGGLRVIYVRECYDKLMKFVDEMPSANLHRMYDPAIIGGENHGP